MSVRKVTRIFAEKFGQAWTACMLSMVQGDLSVISLKHAFIASKTGSITGIAFVIYATWMTRFRNDMLPIYMTGVLTALADWLCGWSPTLIGPLCTGAAAMAICYLYEKIKNGRKKETDTA